MCCDCGCGGKVLVKTAKEHRTCDNYCRSKESKCVGAWEDDENSCDSIKEEVSCSTDVYEAYDGTSDMICKCTPMALGNATCKDDEEFSLNDEKCAAYEKLDCESAFWTLDEKMDLRNSCPRSCGFCESETKKAVEASSDCSTDKWPDVKNRTCGTCMVTITDSDTLCSTYCSNQGLECRSSWAAYDEDPCDMGTKMSCDRKSPAFTGVEVSVGCECGKPAAGSEGGGDGEETSEGQNANPCWLLASSLVFLLASC